MKSAARQRLVETKGRLESGGASTSENEVSFDGLLYNSNQSVAASVAGALREPTSHQRRGRRRLQDASTFELETTFFGDNGNVGVMFDIRSRPGNHTIRVVSLDLHVNLIDPICDMLIYGREGSHLGSETNPENWTLLVNGTMECLGYSLRTHVPPNSFREVPELPGGSTYAFYISLPTPNIRYSNGNQLGAIFSSNEHLEILEGTGVSDFFSGILIQPRVFNGAISYEVAGFTSNDVVTQLNTCDDALTTDFSDNLGSYGNMFDVQAYNNSVVVAGIDFYTDILEPVTYELYTRNGSYVEGLGDISQWVFLKRGTTNGLGSGKGTPIRNFAVVDIPENEKQGFYVTLTKPDIRYQDIVTVSPDVQEGDVYRSNEDMEVQIGIAVGTYPLSTAFFGPRAWSGTIHYTADRACATAAPSTSPSLAPTTSPPTLEPTISAHDFGDCEESSRLATTWSGGTAAFGSFFTVQSYSAPLSISTIEFHVELTTLVDVLVFAKRGNYSGYENIPSMWREASQTQVRGAGSGKGTVIPEDEFDSVHLLPWDTWAFYVTLSTADLKYSRTDLSVGTVFSSDNLLSISTGAGLADPVFGSSIFEPRMFNGAVHFTHTCEPTVGTDVVYTFHIEHLINLTENELLDLVSRNVQETVLGLLTVESMLQEFAQDHGLKVQKTASRVVITPGAEEICFPTSVDRACTSVDTTISLAHLDTLTSGSVIYNMLQFGQAVTQSLSLSELRARYAGDIATDGDLKITFKGDFEREFTDEEVEYFQDVTLEYLGDQLSRLGVGVLGVELKDQQLSRGTFARRLQRSGSSSSEVVVSTTVTGEFRPPPFIDFENVVEDAIDSDNGAGYAETLRNGGRSRPDGLAKGSAFEKVEEIGAEPQTSSLPPPDNSVNSEDGPKFGLIIGIIFACAAVAVAGLYFVRRRRRFARLGGDGALVDHQGSFGGVKSGAWTFFSRNRPQNLFDEHEGIVDADVSLVHNSEQEHDIDDYQSVDELDVKHHELMDTDDTLVSSEITQDEGERSLQGSFRSGLTHETSLRSLASHATERRANLTGSRQVMSTAHPVGEHLGEVESGFEDEYQHDGICNNEEGGTFLQRDANGYSFPGEDENSESFKSDSLPSSNNQVDPALHRSYDFPEPVEPRPVAAPSSPDVAGPHIQRLSPNGERHSPGMPPLNPHPSTRFTQHQASPGIPLPANMVPVIGYEGGMRRPSPVGFTPNSAFSPLPSKTPSPCAHHSSPYSLGIAQGNSPRTFSRSSAFTTPGSSAQSQMRSSGDP